MGFRVITLIGLLAVAMATLAQTPPPQRTITVTGTAQQMAMPDTAIAVLAVQTQAATVGAAVTQNNTAMTKVMDAVKALNVPNLQMRTLGFDVEPIYQQPVPNTPTTYPRPITGYQVVNRLEVRITDTDSTRLSANVGTVLDAGLRAGANRVDSLQFTLENTQPVMQQLTAQATRNATAMAQAIAAAANVQLGPLQNVSTQPVYYPPMPMYARNAEAAQSVPIVVGPTTVQTTVTVVYLIQ